MATKTFNTRIANKRDTSANWTSNNPVLLNGEVIIVDTEAGQVRYKVGNGTSTYTQLPFTDESLITNINGKLSLSGGTMTGNINMGGHKLTDLGAPVNSNDAVRQADLKVVSDEVDGIIAGTTAITLPIADDTKLGGVKIGEGVNVAEDGTISVKPGLPDGGTEGQMLYKTADGTEWGDKPVMVVNVTEGGDGTTSNKTVEEIKEAYLNGLYIFANYLDSLLPLSSVTDVTTSEPSFEFMAYMPLTRTGGILTELSLGRVQIFRTDGKDYTNFYVHEGGLVPTDGNQGETLYCDDVGVSYWGPAPKGIPDGGTTGQVLTKTSTGEEWSDAPSGLPEGGTEGQMLYKSLDGTEWGDKPNIYVSINYSDGSYSADKTYEEIRQLLLDGFHVFAQYGSRIYVLSGCLLESSITSIKFFNAVYVSYRALNGSFLVINPDSSISINSFQLDFKAPTSVAITLTASGWSSNTQTVTVSGVSATETAQLITPTPAIASQTAYYEAGIMCTGQAANSLTFTCQTVPTSNLTVYVVIQPLS